MSLRPPTPLDAGRISGLDESRWAKVLAAALFLAVFSWLFWDVLFHAENLLFRDAAHFYYPLYKYVHEEWAAGRVPLWNPYENCGEPLHAQGVTAAFYPGKLVFFLPIGYDAALRAYILGHVLLCGWAAYFAARKFGRSVWGASLCGLAYAYGGNVLFQIYNVVYLVGAAWLPLALWQAESMLRTRSYRSVVGLAVVLAMMVLGGDPQAAYHSGLIAGAYAVLLWRDDRRQSHRQRTSAEPNALASDSSEPNALKSGSSEPYALASGSSAQPNALASGGSRTTASPAVNPRRGRMVRFARHRLVLLLAAAVAAFLLSAVQMIPTMELSRLSVRAAFDEPRSLYEIPEYLSREPFVERHFSALPSEKRGTEVPHVEPEHGTEVPHYEQAPWYRALLAQGSPYEHEMQAYEFSTGPWRLAEFIWPNFGGKPFPEHRRWLEAIPQEQRMWVPSMYLGIVPFVFALCAWRLRRKTYDVGRVSRPVCSAERKEKRGEGQDVATGSRISSAAKKNEEQTGLETRPTTESTDDLHIRWLSWTVLIFTLGGLGIFGLGWLTREVASLWSQDARDGSGWPVGDAFGGVYWFFTVTLPGYVQFRYPAKLFVPVSLGLSLLAAYGWDRCLCSVALPDRTCWRRPNTLLISILALSVLTGGLLVLAWPEYWQSLVARVPARSLFGPLAPEGSWMDPLYSVIATASLALVALACVREIRGSRWSARAKGAVLGGALLVLSTIDMVVNQSWMIVSEQEESWHADSHYERIMRSHGIENERFDQPFWSYPDHWREDSSPNRLVDALEEEIDTLWSKHALRRRIRNIDSPGAVDQLDYQVFLAHVLRRYEPAAPAFMHPQGLDLLAAQYSIGTNQADFLGARWKLVGFSNIQQNPRTVARAYVVHRCERIPELESRGVSRTHQRTVEVLFRGGAPRNFRMEAIVESDSLLDGANRQQSEALAENGEGTVEVFDLHPEVMEVSLALTRPGLLVLADRFYPGWKAYVETEDEAGEVRDWEAPILRTNRVLRGVWLPEGKHKVTFRYEPWSFYVGAWLSGAAWAGLAVVVGVWAAKRRKSRKKEGKNP